MISMQEPARSLSHIRDVMLSAAECGTWLTLAEISKLTGYSDFNIKARLRELRQAGYTVERRIRSYKEFVHEFLVRPPAEGAR